MTHKNLSTIDFFSKGLVGISHLEADLENQLPPPGVLPPPAMAHRPELEELFSLANLDDLLKAAICPKIADPNILLPTKFQALQNQIIKTLETTTAMGAINVCNPKVLDDAIQVLRDDKSLRILVNQYRNALCAG